MSNQKRMTRKEYDRIKKEWINKLDSREVTLKEFTNFMGKHVEENFNMKWKVKHKAQSEVLANHIMDIQESVNNGH